MVSEGTADQAIVELLWLRAAMRRFLSTFALVVSGAILAAGALRLALLANGQPPQSLPVLDILTYGGIAAAFPSPETRCHRLTTGMNRVMTTTP
jgi:hypothetical protein